MSLVKVPDLSNMVDFDSGKRFIGDCLSQVVQTVNGNLDFGFNVRCFKLSFNFTSANTNFRIDHGLNRQPQGYILIQSNVATSLYDGDGGSGLNYINLKSSQVATVTMLII